MIVKDPRFETPVWNTIIWRYMSFEKFLDVILENRLFFTNTTKMTDKNECSIPRKNADLLWSQGHRILVKKWKEVSDLKRSSFLNCWIMSRFESYALWKIYLSGSKAGIAIKTNTKDLITAFNDCKNPSNERIYFGKVNYTDFIQGEIDISKLITTKKQFYEFENEVRLVILKDPQEIENSNDEVIKWDDGIHINVDPNVLIDEIYLSPFCGSYCNRKITML